MCVCVCVCVCLCVCAFKFVKNKRVGNITGLHKIIASTDQYVHWLQNTECIKYTQISGTYSTGFKIGIVFQKISSYVFE